MSKIEWAMREIRVAKRLPVFSWEVWIVVISFIAGVFLGAVIGIDQNMIIAAAANR